MIGETIEHIVERSARRRLRLAEAGKVGRDEMEAVGEQRNEIAEHMARRGKAVQEQRRRIRAVACFAIEDRNAVDVDGPNANLCHARSP
ncbi:hypothetical protein ASG43_14820 [Aureimonas sp. Leaf454]|nr:hypothetical protein ASG43_14820 [Aureimonas sp. Leaf454]